MEGVAVVTDPLAELEAAEEPADPRTLSQRLVSPHAFDGNGPVPVQVVVAGRDVAKLHVKFVNQWTPGADRLFTNGEIRMLLDAAALQAEWMRELYEARDLLLARLRAAEAVCELGRKGWHGHPFCACKDCATVRARCEMCSAIARWLETRS